MRHQAAQSGRDEEVFRAEVEQARDRASGVVRVQRTEDEMPGERRLDSVPSRVDIADLTHHQNIRILPQQRSERLGETQAERRIDSRLIDAFEHHLDRIFDRGDVDVVGRELSQCRVKGRRLAGAGRPRDENDAVRALDEAFEESAIARGKSEFLKVVVDDVRIENTHDDLLAKRHRQRRDAKFHGLGCKLGFDAPILWSTLLADVEPREGLDAVDDRLVHHGWQPVHFVERAVDAKTDDGLLALGFDVDVARALLKGVSHQVLDGVHDVLIARLDLVGALHPHELLEIADVNAARELVLGALDRATKAVKLSN